MDEKDNNPNTELALAIVRNMPRGIRFIVFGTTGVDCKIFRTLCDMEPFWEYVREIPRSTIYRYGQQILWALAWKRVETRDRLGTYLEQALTCGEWLDAAALLACGISLPTQTFDACLISGKMQHEARIRALKEASLHFFRVGSSMNVVTFLDQKEQETNTLMNAIYSALCLMNGPQVEDIEPTNIDNKEQMLSKMMAGAQRALDNMTYMGIRSLQKRIEGMQHPQLGEAD